MTSQLKSAVGRHVKVPGFPGVTLKISAERLYQYGGPGDESNVYAVHVVGITGPPQQLTKREPLVLQVVIRSTPTETGGCGYRIAQIQQRHLHPKLRFRTFGRKQAGNFLYGDAPFWKYRDFKALLAFRKALLSVLAGAARRPTVTQQLHRYRVNTTCPQPIATIQQLPPAPNQPEAPIAA